MSEWSYGKWWPERGRTWPSWTVRSPVRGSGWETGVDVQPEEAVSPCWSMQCKSEKKKELSCTRLAYLALTQGNGRRNKTPLRIPNANPVLTCVTAWIHSTRKHHIGNLNYLAVLAVTYMLREAYFLKEHTLNQGLKECPEIKLQETRAYN